jgi:hypothetical protein
MRETPPVLPEGPLSIEALGDLATRGTTRQRKWLEQAVTERVAEFALPVLDVYGNGDACLGHYAEIAGDDDGGQLLRRGVRAQLCGLPEHLALRLDRGDVLRGRAVVRALATSDSQDIYRLQLVSVEGITSGEDAHE